MRRFKNLIGCEDTSRNPTTRRHSTGSWRYEHNSAKTRIWKMVEGGDYCCQECRGCYQYWYLHFSGKCQQATKTFGHWIWKNFWIRVSEHEHLCYGILVTAKQTSGSYFLTILIWVSYLIDKDSWLSPSRSENKESWELLTTGTTRLLGKDENKESQGSCDVPDGFFPNTQR